MNAPLPPAPLRTRLALARPWQALLAAAGLGAATATGFAPYSWPVVPIVALAGFLLLLAARPRQGFLLGLAFGMAHFALGLAWIATAFTYQAAMPPVLGWVAVAGLCLFLAVYPALAAAIAGRLARGLPSLLLLLAGLWVMAELARGLLFTGFAWHPLGSLLLVHPGLVQLAAVVGAYGLSALVLLMAGALALLVDRPARWRWPVAALLLLGLIGIGLRQLPAPGAGTARFLLVQPGTSIAEKNAPGGLARSLEAAVSLTRGALGQGPAPAAVVWPEATVEFPMEELPALRRQLVEGFEPGTLLLTGGVAIERGLDGRATGARNSFYALDATGDILARYDKAHLVPGGEYLPLRAIAEPLGLERLVPGTLDFLPGPGPTSWRLPGLPALSPNICYEIVFPGAVVDRRDRPSLLITVSNDAWFGPSGPPQHHDQARLRAIEEGLPVLRVTPTGLTGLIDPRGAMTATLPRHRAGMLWVTPQAPLPATPFARLGLWAPLLLAIGLVGAGLSQARRKT
jgi:apolipoprotein N-acyltransferase